MISVVFVFEFILLGNVMLGTLVRNLSVLVADKFIEINQSVFVAISTCEHLIHQRPVHVLEFFRTIEGGKFFGVKLSIIVQIGCLPQNCILFK